MPILRYSKSIPHLLLLLSLPLIVAACAKHPGGGMAFPPAPVGVQKINASTVADASEFVATLISRHSVTLQSQVPGQITAIYVKAGDVVKKGAPLLLVDPNRQQAAVESAAAAAQSQQATIAQTQAGIQILEEQRQALESAVEASRSQYNRYATLANQKSASAQDVERYRDELNRAQANLAANTAQTQAQQAAVITAQKQYEQARSLTREQQAQLKYHRISAPFSGIVGDVPVKLGNYVQPLTQLLSVTDNDPLEVNLNVPAEHASDLRLGLPVELLSESGQPLAKTRLTFVSPRVDVESQTVLVKATLPNPGGRLKADQIVNARIIWKSFPGVRIPTESVIHMGGRDFVYIVASPKPQQTVAKLTPVMLGRIEGPFYIVQSGLKPGDTLIVSGVQKLADGAPVKPQ